jgi:DNA-binding transcriptional ArsR family regulator
MKQITDIEDARLVKGLAHPLRIQILRALEDRIASPSEIADEIGAPLGNVSYHVRFLARMGLIELSGTEPRRGAVEHYYRSAGRVGVSEETWATVPQVVRDAVLSSTLEQVGRSVGVAAASGGFSGDDAHASRTDIVLDSDGLADLSAAVAELHRRATDIERESSERIATHDGAAQPADGDGGGVRAQLVLMLFGDGDGDGEVAAV